MQIDRFVSFVLNENVLLHIVVICRKRSSQKGVKKGNVKFAGVLAYLD